jgi:hypothetical protein
MADNKYGQVFTEDDVKQDRSQIAIENEITGADELDEILSNGFTDRTFPFDEPLFVSCAGRTKASLPTIIFYEYYRCTSHEGSPHNQIAAVHHAIDQFGTFSRDNSDQDEGG